MSKYFQYETGVRAASPRELVRAAQSRNINKLSTLQILTHLYKRHEISLLYIALVSVGTWVIVTQLG